jgi:hypothetical protein
MFTIGKLLLMVLEDVFLSFDSGSLFRQFFDLVPDHLNKLAGMNHGTLKLFLPDLNIILPHGMLALPGPMILVHLFKGWFIHLNFISLMGQTEHHLADPDGQPHSNSRYVTFMISLFQIFLNLNLEFITSRPDEPMIGVVRAQSDQWASKPRCIRFVRRSRYAVRFHLSPNLAGKNGRGQKKREKRERGRKGGASQFPFAGLRGRPRSRRVCPGMNRATACVTQRSLP